MLKRPLPWIAAVLLSGCSDDPTATDGDDSTPDFEVPSEFTFTGTDGTRLSAHASGAGDVVVVALHGGPGFPSSYMEDLARLAGPARVVVRYDQRGVGESADAVSGRHGRADHVGDLESLRLYLGVEQLHLLGHSWGAFVAAAYADEHPDRVASFLTFGGMPPTWPEVAEGMARFQAKADELRDRGLVQHGLEPYFSDPAFAMPAEVAALVLDQEIFDTTIAAVAGYDLTSGLAALPAPSLVVIGEGDPYGVEWGESTAAALGEAGALEVLTACGQFWQECPDPFFAAAGDFLDAHAGPRE